MKPDSSGSVLNVQIDPSDKVFYAIVREILEGAGLPLSCTPQGQGLYITQSDESLPPDGFEKLSLSKPFRAGWLLKQLAEARRRALSAEPVLFGPYTLMAPDALVLRPGQEQVRLTDLERDTILALAYAKGRRLDRKTLLEKVWGYVDGVETHAVETLIYRLRQKIEPDPANLAFLLTDGSGYRLVE